MNSQVRLFYIISLSLIASCVYSQEIFKPRLSPLAVIGIRYKDSYIKIVYSQPQKRGREIFGKLVPYGQIWRTGANEATEITLTKDILINNQLLKAGTYTIFTIPQPDKWTIIINSDVGLWGAYNYTSKLDILRFDLPVLSNDTIFEALTMSFEQKNDVAELWIIWDRVKISIPVKFL